MSDAIHVHEEVVNKQSIPEDVFLLIAKFLTGPIVSLAK
jgi:hypothetical protein